MQGFFVAIFIQNNTYLSIKIILDHGLIIIVVIHEVELLHLDAGYEVGYGRIRFKIILDFPHGPMFGYVIVTSRSRFQVSLTEKNFNSGNGSENCKYF